MKSIEKLRQTAKAANEMASLQNEKVVTRSVIWNIEYLEEAIQEAAKNGKFETMSDNLCDPKYRRGSCYSQDEMRDILMKALIEYFSALGFSCDDDHSNYLTVSWKENKE